MSSRSAFAGVTRPVVIALVAGLLLGSANSLSNVFGSAYSDHALKPYEGVFILEVLAAVLGTMWAWACVAYIVGWLSPRVWLAPVMGVLSLLAAVLAYYFCDHWGGLNESLSTYEIVFWSRVSLLVGPILGLLGFLSRAPHWWSVVPGLTIPAIVAVTAETPPAVPHPADPWPHVVAWGVAVTLVIATITRWFSLRSSLSRNSQ